MLQTLFYSLKVCNEKKMTGANVSGLAESVWGKEKTILSLSSLTNKMRNGFPDLKEAFFGDRRGSGVPYLSVNTRAKAAKVYQAAVAIHTHTHTYLGSG